MIGPSDAPYGSGSLGDQIDAMIDHLPEGSLTLGELLDVFGDEGLLLLTVLLTLVFLVPVAVPGVSTVFGGAILLIGLSRLRTRPLWLPRRFRERELPASKLRSALIGGTSWVRRLDRISRPHRLPLAVDGRTAGTVVDLSFILAALLLMAPFGFVPFSNTLPAVALMLYAIGLMQRDGIAVLLGHLAAVATIVYFGILIAGGGVALRELLHRLTG